MWSIKSRFLFQNENFQSYHSTDAADDRRLGRLDRSGIGPVGDRGGQQRSSTRTGTNSEKNSRPPEILQSGTVIMLNNFVLSFSLYILELLSLNGLF